MLYNGLPVSPSKLPLPMLASGPHVIRFIGPTRVRNASGVTEGGRGGQLPPGAAGKGAQNSVTKNIL